MIEILDLPPERRTEIVRRIGLAAAKARSNAAEADTLRAAELLDPETYGDGPLSLVEVSDRMLKNGRVPEPIDIVNILYLARRSPTFDVIYFVYWQEDLPT